MRIAALPGHLVTTTKKIIRSPLTWVNSAISALKGLGVKPKISYPRWVPTFGVVLIGVTFGLLIHGILYFFMAHHRAPEQVAVATQESDPALTNINSAQVTTATALDGNSGQGNRLSKPSVYQLTAEQIAILRQAYTEAAETNPNLMGSVVVRIKTDPSGNILALENARSRVSDSGFLEKVFAAVEKWKFPPAEAPAEFTLPLLFVPVELDARTIARWEQTVNSSDEQGKMLPIQITNIAKTQKKRAPGSLKNQPAGSESLSRLLAAEKIQKSQEPESQPIDHKLSRAAPLRREPRFAAETTENVGAGTMISVLEKKGDWVKVRTRPSGSVGYVRKEYVVSSGPTR